MIRRAKVLDHVFRTVDEPGFLRGSLVPKMFESRAGLHVKAPGDNNIWTIYPWHTVQWVEETR